jgi:triosephosphate isomerase
MPRVVVAGNWKMNLTYTEAIKLATDINYGCNGIEAVEIIVAPPYVSLFGIKQVIGNGPVKLAAQNMFYEDYGAFTGEISPLMLRETCDYVILGHSERRMMFGESNQLVNMKAQSAIRHGMSPIICVGETTEERDSGEAENVIMKQLQESLENIIDISGLIIAYEPVWAIGTGQSATPTIANDMMGGCVKKTLTSIFGSQSDDIPVLYGGSVSSVNTLDFLNCESISGVLVGSASLDGPNFIDIIRQASTVC